MYKFWLHLWIVCFWKTTEANFLSIPIISCWDTATFQFVPLVPQVAEVAYFTNIFATSLILAIYVLNNKVFM